MTVATFSSYKESGRKEGVEIALSQRHYFHPRSSLSVCEDPPRVLKASWPERWGSAPVRWYWASRRQNTSRTQSSLCFFWRRPPLVSRGQDRAADPYEGR